MPSVCWQACSRRVTIRPGFPGHVLFLSPCPGGFPGIWLLSGFSPFGSTIDTFLLIFRVIYYKKFRELKTRAGIGCVFSFRPLAGVWLTANVCQH